MHEYNWETPPSDILGARYNIVKQLSKKAGRRTLLARDRKTEKLVVVKLLSFASDFEWDALKLFEREAKILQAISHPAIPRYLDYCELDLNNGNRGFALIQSYIPAKSLEEYLKSRRSFDEAEIKQLAKAVLEILIYLHGRQPPVIHRDIKPSNILLGDRSGNSIGQVYLVDFGSVQTLAAKEGGTMTIVGTYGYMPPEQFGDRTVPASDLYSFGTTLVYLVTGTHPANLSQKDGRIQFESFTNLSHEFIQWLQRMIEPGLDRRFTSAENALQKLIQPQSVTIVPSMVKEPSYSKIKLTRKIDSSEILLPARRWNYFSFISSIVITIIMAIYTEVLVIPITSEYISGVYGFSSFSLIGLGFLWSIDFGFAYVLISNLLNQFNRIKLKISERKVTAISTVFGLEYQVLQVLDVNKQGVTALRFEYNTNPASLWLDIYEKKCYPLFVSLTQPEREWLARELSVCLGIEIEIFTPY